MCPLWATVQNARTYTYQIKVLLNSLHFLWKLTAPIFHFWIPTSSAQGTLVILTCCWRALARQCIKHNNNTKLCRMKDRRLGVGWFTITILREILLSRSQFGRRSSGEWINVFFFLYSSLPLMFLTHNPYYGSKQLNKHNCAEKG